MTSDARLSPWQQCATCGHRLPDTAPEALCPQCGGLFELIHPAPRHAGSALRATWDHQLRMHANLSIAEASGVWRFSDVVLPVPSADIVSHPEGNTPLLRRAALAQWSGVTELFVKHEGHNPTGSFKDRGMTVAVTQARRVGARAVICASTGNTSSSLASYAAQAGLPAIVLVPAGYVAAGKLAQTVAYGARTLLVRGDFDDCLRLVREAARQLGVYLVNSLNPFRLEGQKTIVFELLQQLQWDVPDWIVLPAGNLGNTAAFGKALRELHAWGVIARVPRIGAIQAQGAAPFVASYDSKFTTRHRVTAHTIATAIQIGDPASYDRAVRTITETDGMAVAVSDDEILDAKAVIDASGVGAEPASAASLAGVRRLRSQGHIRATDRVVAVLTGHMLKDPGAIADYHMSGHPHARANPPVDVDPTLDAIAAVIGHP